ncbi:rhomboid family intramembrane serine protease [Nitratifractor sp.]
MSFPLTYTLIGLNLLGYTVEGILGGRWMAQTPDLLAALGGVWPPAVLYGGEWWRLFTAMFLHGGLEHLALNMFSLLIVGRIVESFFVRWEYLLLYLLSGFIGFVASMMMHPQSVAIGASGAIFGIFGAIVGFVLFHRKVMGDRFGEVMREFGIVLLINLIFGLAVPSIDMSAHVAGFLVGLLGGYLAIGARWAFVLYCVVLGIGSTLWIEWMRDHLIKLIGT